MKASQLIRILFVGGFASFLNAQERGLKMEGKVTDTGHEPLEGVAVLLKSTSDSAYVVGAITDSCGRFVFPDLPPRGYRTEFLMLGYKKQCVEVLLTEDRCIGEVTLEEDARQLASVVVTGKHTFMKMTPGKTTFAMEGTARGADGSLLQVLRSLPGVLVNEDGRVILNGQAGATLLINGKSTYLSGDKLVNYLRSLPVSAIKSIELITSPSAKYEAAGKTGLIDIQTRRVAAEGWTLQVNSGYRQAYDGKWNVGGRFTCQRGKLGMFIDYAHHRGKYKSTLDMSREFEPLVRAVPTPSGISGLDTSARNAIVQYSRMKDHNGGDWVRVGLEYEINDRFSSELSQTVTGFHKFQTASTFTVLSDVRNQADSLLYTNSFSRIGQRASSGGAQVNYKDEKDRTADFSFDYFVHAHTQKLSMHSEMENTGKQVMNRDTLKGDMKSRIRMYSLQANGSLPLSERFKLDFGAKFTWVDLDNQTGYANRVAGGWLLNSSLSNRYAYNENIRAGYIQLSAKVGKCSLEAGLRLEQTQVGGTQYPANSHLPDSSHTDRYLHWFPSLGIQYPISGTGHVLSFLYNKRIIRPSYGDLSPFSYRWDKYTYSTGNPELRPELTDQVEFAYIHRKAGRATLFFSYTKAPIMQHIELSGEDVAVVYPENFKNNLRTGLRFDAADLIRKKGWRISVNATLYYSLYKWQEAGCTVEKQLLTPAVGMHHQFLLPAGITVEVSGFYNGRMAFGQATVDPHGAVAVALVKKMWEDRLTIRLHADDLFQSNRQNLTLDLSGRIGKASTRQFNDYRCIGISVSVNLKQGKSSEKSRRERGIDQSKRINL